MISVAFIFFTLAASASSLTPTEEGLFVARTHIEQNTGVQGTVELSKNRTHYILNSNGIPDHDTGTFPNEHTEFSISSQQQWEVEITRRPTILDISLSTDLPSGAIGFAWNGVPIYNYQSFVGEDAVVTEADTFDDCDGHPDDFGVYHYHQELPDACKSDDVLEEEFLGIALDGVPILTGEVASHTLDDCHGRYEGRRYVYRVTSDQPYTLGCFRATPAVCTTNYVNGVDVHTCK